MQSCHCGLSGVTGPSGAQAGPLTSIHSTPPMPTRCMASRSAVIPSLLMLPLIQNQYTHGLALAGGLANPASRSAPAAWLGFAVDVVLAPQIAVGKVTAKVLRRNWRRVFMGSSVNLYERSSGDLYPNHRKPWNCDQPSPVASSVWLGNTMATVGGTLKIRAAVSRTSSTPRAR